MNLSIEPFQSEMDVTLAHSTTGNSSTFNLEDSNVHNNIEIDGSLSRKDLYFGDNVHFDEAIWAQSSSKFEGDIITIRTAAGSRRYRTSMAKAEVGAYCTLVFPSHLLLFRKFHRSQRSGFASINTASVINTMYIPLRYLTDLTWQPEQKFHGERIYRWACAGYLYAGLWGCKCYAGSEGLG